MVDKFSTFLNLVGDFSQCEKSKRNEWADRRALLFDMVTEYAAQSVMQ